MRMVARRIFLVSKADRFCLFRHDDGWLLGITARGIAIGHDRGVVQPGASALPFGFADMHLEQADVVFVDGGQNDQEKALGRIGKVEVGVADRGKADVVLAQQVEDIEGVIHRPRQPRQFVHQQNVEITRTGEFEQGVQLWPIAARTAERLDKLTDHCPAFLSSVVAHLVQLGFERVVVIRALLFGRNSRIQHYARSDGGLVFRHADAPQLGRACAIAQARRLTAYSIVL